MTIDELLGDSFARIHEVVHLVVVGLTPNQLAFRPDPGANSIAWLIWHLTRVQDDHLADVAGTQQVWTSQGWFDRFGLPFDPAVTGYGHSVDEVGHVTVASAELLTGYHDAVYEQTTRFLSTVAISELDRIVDQSWNPPVTLGARLVSVISDDLQHAGQAAYVRGLVTQP